MNWTVNDVGLNFELNQHLTVSLTTTFFPTKGEKSRLKRWSVPPGRDPDASPFKKYLDVDQPPRLVCIELRVELNFELWTGRIDSRLAILFGQFRLLVIEVETQYLAHVKRNNWLCHWTLNWSGLNFELNCAVQKSTSGAHVKFTGKTTENKSKNFVTPSAAPFFFPFQITLYLFGPGSDWCLNWSLSWSVWI